MDKKQLIKAVYNEAYKIEKQLKKLFIKISSQIKN